MKRSQIFLVSTLLLALCACLPQQQSEPARAAATGTTAVPTYYRDVRPIIAEHCVSCHQEKKGAPFLLTGYRDAEKRAPQIAQVTNAKFMPPWKPDSHGELFGENRLSAQEIDILQRWASDGAPAGQDLKASMTTAAKTMAAVSAPELGIPDAELKPAKPSYIPADGPDFYRCYVLHTNFDKDRYLSAIVVQPGNASAVDHALVYQDITHRVRFMNEIEAGGAFTVQGSTTGLQPAMVVAGWGIASQTVRFPTGSGILLRRGADLVVETHCRPTGKPETDLPRLLLYFCKGRVMHRVRVAPVMPPNLRMPPNFTDMHIGGQSPVTGDITVVSILPYMRRHGAAITAGILPLDHKQNPLLTIPQWDFDWIGDYRFKQPVKVPAGSLLTMEATFNNVRSSHQTGNGILNAGQDDLLLWGDRPSDENAVAYMFYTTDAEIAGQRDIAGVPDAGGPAQAGMIKIILKMFDANHDGTIDPAEYRNMRGYFRGGMPSMAGMEM